VDLNEFIEQGRPAGSRHPPPRPHRSAGLKSLSLEEAREFAASTRRLLGPALGARALGLGGAVESLNDLVALGYAQTYPGKRPRLRDAVEFYRRGFPQLVRAEWKAVVAAYVLFLSGMLFGYAAMQLDPSSAVYLVPEQHQSLDPDKRVAEEAKNEKGMSADHQTAFSSFLFTHNIQVAFLAFALGLTLGIGTVILLFVNGVFLGALAVAYEAKGHAVWFWAWILPHGVPEISAICLAGAAGLLLGRALVAPGSRSRADALRVEGRLAVRLVLGTLPIFVAAGIIEGTLSQIHESAPCRRSSS
jgi:uncharacterized membrane protein SpoIIM required for sporulation